MIHNATRATLCCLLALTSACVPILPHDEYVPQMTGARVLVEPCWGNKRFEYQTDGITLSGRIIKWPPGLLKLELRFDVPEGSTVELQGRDVSVSSLKTNDVKFTRIPGISLTENPSLPLEPIGSMIGRDFFINGQRNARHFWLFAPLEDIISDDMRVMLPIVKVNGRAVTIPDIRFTRQVRIQLMAPMQC